MRVRLGDLVAALGGELIGDAALVVDAIAPLERAGPTHITFLAHARLLPRLLGSDAACVVVGSAHRQEAVARGAAIVTADPYLYLSLIHI